MSLAIQSQLAVISRANDDATPVYEPIAEITNFQLGGGESADVDVSSLDSQAKEFFAGLQDNGSFSIDMNLVSPVDAGQAGLRADKTAGAPRDFRIVLPDDASTTMDFAATVKSFDVSGGVDEAVKASSNMRVSGAITWS